MTTTRPTDMLHLYVKRHNLGVRSGDFVPMLALFHPDAVLQFNGLGLGPFQGLAKISEAFRDMPPSEELVVLDTTEVQGSVSASYSVFVKIISSPSICHCRLKMNAVMNACSCSMISSEQVFWVVSTRSMPGHTLFSGETL